MHYEWQASGEKHKLSLVPVPGTAGTPYLFGRAPNQRPIAINNFHIATTTVTWALWAHVMGSDPSGGEHPRRPANVSYNDVTGPGGFLERINASEILPAVTSGIPGMRFRLPSETEWEYAARGGPHWRDGSAFSGSNDIDAVAWYGDKWSGGSLKWNFRKWRKNFLGGLFAVGKRETYAHDVGLKAPNQLGIHDMSGNVWEWCEDFLNHDVAVIPSDGCPYLGAGDERVLRGGDHTNWDMFCTVNWRYGIVPAAKDGCIGVRVVVG